MTKHWYHLDTADGGEKDALCRFLRRQRLEHKTSRLPGRAYRIAMYIDADELDEVRAWLRTH